MVKIRAVIDTNVFLSAIFFKGIPAAIVKLAEAGIIQSITSKLLLGELSDKLVNKFNQSPQATKKIIKRIKRCSKLTRISGKARFSIKDPKDHMVIETALKGKANFVITGDHHLQGLGTYKEIKFIAPADFIKEPGLKKKIREVY